MANIPKNPTALSLVCNLFPVALGVLEKLYSPKIKKYFMKGTKLIPGARTTAYIIEIIQ